MCVVLECKYNDQTNKKWRKGEEKRREMKRREKEGECV